MNLEFGYTATRHYTGAGSHELRMCMPETCIPQRYGPDGVPLDGPRTTAAAYADTIGDYGTVAAVDGPHPIPWTISQYRDAAAVEGEGWTLALREGRAMFHPTPDGPGPQVAPPDDFEEVMPRCDICGELEEEQGLDWNGDTGNHRTCERDGAPGGDARDAEMKARGMWAAVGRIVERAADYAVRRDDAVRRGNLADVAAEWHRAAESLAFAACHAADAHLCDIAMALDVAAVREEFGHAYPADYIATITRAIESNL